MSTAHIFTAFILSTSLVLCACDHYRGDGTLSDAGIGTADERYTVDLGVVTLGSLSQQSFNMAGLPPTEFTMGIRPIYVSAGCDATALSSTRIRLDVHAEDGSVVISEEGPLSTWTTSRSLIYRRGTERQEPKADGVFELIRTGVRASGGWGTYFTPHRGDKYSAQFGVLEAHSMGCKSHLVLIGGGWK
jgi:hypothetical protein